MRRIIDPAKQALIDKMVKDTEDKKPVLPATAPGSIEDILKCQLAGLDRLSKFLVSQISSGEITKDTAQQLATCIKITMDLRTKEKELLEEISDEDLEKITEHDNE